MRHTDRDGSGSPADAREPAADVTTCPFCQSTSIITTGKSASPSAYWRCQGCGQVWHPAREDAARALRRPRWGQGPYYS